MSRKKKRRPLPSISPDHWLVDSHCHLDMTAYNEDLPDVLGRAKSAGIAAIITIGIDPPSSQAAVSLAQNHTDLYAAVGIHPHHAEGVSEQIKKEMRHLAGQNKVIAYGEIGIDCFKDYAPLADQISCMRWQLELAQELELPVIIHDRDAHQLILDILIEMGPFPAGGVIHCFSGDAQIAEKFLECGFYLSIPGVVTFKKAVELQEAATMIPLNRLLVETDGPFLAPEPWRGKRNEPAYTLYTAEKIAELKNISLDDIAEATSHNIEKLFRIEIKK